MRLSRRSALAATGTAIACALAGCGAASDDRPADGAVESGTDGDAGEGATTPATSPTPELDLREANVTAVSIAETDGGIRFDVGLYHDDDGEEGYANWWQVERLDGGRLGRRELLHAHGTREFTRSATVSVPESVRCVVVRGHDETHGYGGRAMLVALPSGATRAMSQGAEPASFEESDCP